MAGLAQVKSLGKRLGKVFRCDTEYKKTDGSARNRRLSVK